MKGDFAGFCFVGLRLDIDVVDKCPALDTLDDIFLGIIINSVVFSIR